MGSCCFLLPRFVPASHAFGLKIATAAMRPRNDTKLGRFYFGNIRFGSCKAVSLRDGFETFRPENCSVFPTKPADSVIARRALVPDVAIFNGTICHPGTKHGRMHNAISLWAKPCAKCGRTTEFHGEAARASHFMLQRAAVPIRSPRRTLDSMPCALWDRMSTSGSKRPGGSSRMTVEPPYSK